MTEERKTVNFRHPFQFACMTVGNAYIIAAGHVKTVQLEFTATDDKWDPFVAFVPFNTDITIIVNDDGVRLNY